MIRRRAFVATVVFLGACAATVGAEMIGSTAHAAEAEAAVETAAIFAEANADKLAADIQGAGVGAARPPSDDLDEVLAGLQAYLERQGVSGEGQAMINGSPVLFVFATASVAVPKGSPNYVDARTLAFEQAFQDALAKLVVRKRADITSQVESSLQQDTTDQQVLIDACKPGAAEQLGRKALQLIDAGLSKALKAAGAAADTQAGLDMPLKACSNPILKSAIARRLETATYAALEGVRVVHSLIVGDDVGVVAATSRKGAEAARMLRAGSRAARPLADPVAGIRRSIGTLEPADLLGTLGTRLIWLENGEPAIVSFGMAGSGVRDTDSGPMRSERRRAAMSAAEQRAQGELASFSQVSTYFTQTQSVSASYSETAKVEGDVFSKELSAEAGREMMRSIRSSSKLRVTGAQSIRRWSAIDPASGDQVEGVVLAWSPSLQSAVTGEGRPASAAAEPQPGKNVRLRSKDFKEDW